MSEYEMLKELIAYFYVNSKGNLEWSYTEGRGVGDYNKELDEALQIFKEKVESYV